MAIEKHPATLNSRLRSSKPPKVATISSLDLDGFEPRAKIGRTPGVAPTAIPEEDLEVCMNPRGRFLDATDDEQDEVFRRNYINQRQRWRIIKNISFLSLSILFGYISIVSIPYLRQISEVIPQHLVFIDHVAQCSSLAIGCLFLAQPIISILGYRCAISGSFIGHVIYTCIHFYPTFEIVITGSVLYGLCSSILLISSFTYVTKSSVLYATLKNESNLAVISKFFGILFMAFQSSHVWGQMITGFVLETTHVPSKVLFSPSPLELHPPNSLCGAKFCPASPHCNISNSSSSSTEVNQMKTYSVLGIFAGFSLLACVIAAVGIGRLSSSSVSSRQKQAPEKSPSRCSCCCSVFSTMKIVLRDARVLSLFPLILHTGLQNAFFHQDFIQNFVSCSIGSWSFPFLFMTYGGLSALSSIISGSLTKHTGRVAPMVIAALLQMGLYVWFFFWQLRDFHFYYFVVIMALWSMTDAIWTVTILSTLGSMNPSKHSSSTFANYVLWLNAGFAVTSFAGHFLCVYMKLYVLLGVLCLGIGGYFIAESFDRRRKMQAQVSNPT